MKDEKILQDEKLSDEQLEKVVGGVQQLNGKLLYEVSEEDPNRFTREQIEKMKEKIWGKI